MTQKEIEEQLEEQNLSRSISVLLSQPHGKNFIKYLFETFNVGHMPPAGIPGDRLVDIMGLYRTGNMIYQRCLIASPELTGMLISEMVKTKESKDVQETHSNESSNRG